MVVDLSDAVPFLTWFPWALADWLLAVFVISLAVTAVGWLIAAIRRGPIYAFAATGKVWYAGLADLCSISRRRVKALSWLAVKESIRRRVVVVFAIFILVLLYAGWFLDPESTPDPALVIYSLRAHGRQLFGPGDKALFLSAMSLPSGHQPPHAAYYDYRARKDASGIVLGRIIGFTVVGTFLLVVMGLICYVFVIRRLAHTHELTAPQICTRLKDRHPLKRPRLPGGQVSIIVHRATLSRSARRAKSAWNPDKATRARSPSRRTATRRCTSSGRNKARAHGPRADLRSIRSFATAPGNPGGRGVDVGKEWTYRRLLRRGDFSATIWTFNGVATPTFPDGLPIVLNISVYRTYTGEITKGLPDSLSHSQPTDGQDG